MNARQAQQVVRGLATFVPGLRRLFAKGVVGTSARYCYSVWLRHLVLAYENGLQTRPAVVAELGPGDSLGMGAAALLCGAEKFFAFDVVEYANARRNVEIFDELIDLFVRREDIPGEHEFPNVWPRLSTYSFPRHVLPDDMLDIWLEGTRLTRIRQSLKDSKAPGSMVTYTVPWYGADVIQKASVDMIYSQAVMQHIDALDSAYKSFYDWLRPGGFMSHQIDLSSLGTADPWNAHWTYSDFTWRLMRGNRAYFLNREPHSSYVHLSNENGFRIVCDMIRTAPSAAIRSRLSARFRNLSDQDLTTRGMFLQAVKV